MSGRWEFRAAADGAFRFDGHFADGRAHLPGGFTAFTRFLFVLAGQDQPGLGCLLDFL